MSLIKETEKYITEVIKECGFEIDSVVLEPSSRRDLGEAQINVCMSLAKKYGKNPRELAELIVSKFDDRFVNAYLQTIKSVYLDPDECLIGDYNADSVMFYQNERWQFYEWIPSLEEVEANMEDTKPLVLTINQ